jgi:hypothetical protein
VKHGGLSRQQVSKLVDGRCKRKTVDGQWELAEFPQPAHLPDAKPTFAVDPRQQIQRPPRIRSPCKGKDDRPAADHCGRHAEMLSALRLPRRASICNFAPPTNCPLHIYANNSTTNARCPNEVNIKVAAAAEAGGEVVSTVEGVAAVAIMGEEAVPNRDRRRGPRRKTSSTWASTWISRLRSSSMAGEKVRCRPTQRTAVADFPG